MTAPGRDEGEPLPWGVVIPDDISALDAEVHAFRREASGRRRRARRAGRIFTRRWRRYGVSGRLVVLVLAAVAMVGSLMALLTRGRHRERRRDGGAGPGRPAAGHVPAPRGDRHPGGRGRRGDRGGAGPVGHQPARARLAALLRAEQTP